MAENAQRDRGAVAFTDLNSDEDNDEETKPNEKANDTARFPREGSATPLESKEKADNTTDEQASTKNVYLFDLLPSGQIADLANRVLEENQDSQESYAAEREIDLRQDNELQRKVTGISSLPKSTCDRLQSAMPMN